MEETVILEFKVDQAAAQTALEQTEKALIDLRKEQTELTKSYKAGTITQTQYIKENLRLHNSIKKEQDQKRTLIKTVETESNSRNALRLEISRLTKEYDNLNKETAEGAKRADDLEKELSQLTTQLNKGDKAAGLFKNQIGNYPAAFQSATSSIRVAGVSVGDIGAKLTSFLNPATAAIGVVTALGAAYARSTRGAKDLEFAQNQLSAVVTSVTNNFGKLISSAEDGEGALTKLLNVALKFSVIGITDALGITNIVEESKKIANAQEILDDLLRDEIEIRGQISERLGENQEQLSIISDTETEINDKLKATDVIEENLVKNQTDLVGILNKQLQQLRIQLKGDEENEAIQTRINELKKEIGKEELQTTKKIEANNRLQDDLLAKLREQQRLEEGANRRSQTSDDAAILTGTGQDPRDVGTVQPTETAASNAEEFQRGHADRMLKINQDFYKKDAEFKRKAAEVKADIDRDSLRKTETLFAETADLFAEGSEAFKILTTGQIIANTYAAATAALAPPPVGAGPIFGPAFAAVAIATGLANLARVNGIEFAEGGYTGSGQKYDVAGVVHKGEYVAPKHIVESSQAKPHLMALESMRTRGYADGGFVTNQAIDATQQALIMTNALRNMPPAVVDVREVTTKQNRIRVRENLTKLG
jgi:predicted  nucleic acid-binding Zn-ribbon protein